jgi:hypothetical protein
VRPTQEYPERVENHIGENRRYDPTEKMSRPVHNR